MRTEPTEIGDAGRTRPAADPQLPGEPGQLTFEHPWELRAFAVAVAAYHSGQYDWSEFQLALIDAIRRWEGAEHDAPWRYYDRWLEALETVLSGTGVLSGTELDDRTRSVLDTPRDAGHHHARHEPLTIDPAR
ncbi:MAG: nitrile hydratase accessory protein [Egibacteraceae bacterium]